VQHSLEVLEGKHERERTRDALPNVKTNTGQLMLSAPDEVFVKRQENRRLRRARWDAGLPFMVVVVEGRR